MKNKILCIDDDAQFLMLLKRRLSERYDVDTTTSTVKGLKLINENDYYCLIFDYDMPEYNGIDLAKIVKKNPRLCNIPIILITGMADETIQQLAIDNGISVYFLKTINIDYDLIATQIESLTTLHRITNGLNTIN